MNLRLWKQSVQSVQLLSRVQLFATPWITARQASLSITNSQSPPKPMSIVLVMPSNHLILSRPLLFLPSIFPSIKVFSNESAFRIRWVQLQHQSLQWSWIMALWSPKRRNTWMTKKKCSYSGPLNSMSLNCMGPLICGFFSINTTVVSSWLGHVEGWI